MNKQGRSDGRRLKVQVPSIGPALADRVDHTPCELEGAVVRSPRDVEYEAFLHPGDVETYDDLVHIADEVDDGMKKAESEDYRHAFIPYYG